MPLSASAITDAILALEQHVGLDDPAWTEGDVHWWPLYRTEIYRLLFVADAGAAPAARNTSRLGPALRASTLEHQPSSPRAVWLVSDGLSYAKASGEREIERFCGPLWQRCATAGVPAVVIDRASPVPRATREPSRWWAPTTQRAKIIGIVNARLALLPRHARLVEKTLQAAAVLGLSQLRMSARRMQAMASATLRLARLVEHRLRLERVRAVFIVSFYDVAGYAYCLAAARARVTSIDVQHGMTGRYHMAYSQWPTTQTPWRLLPRWFWTWTEADAALVRTWAPPSSHHAICGGHPYLDAWRDGTLPLDAAVSRSLLALRERCGERTPVIVTLQPHLVHEQALAPLLWTMARCVSAFWWLRLHPMRLDDRPALEALLASKGIDTFDIETATMLPLPVVLSHARVHATHSSSAFVEAAALGVPSIVWSAYGAELAQDAVAAGSAHAALDGPSFTALIDTGVTITTTPGSVAPLGRDALRTILESCPA
jgi:hypothetical protein